MPVFMPRACSIRKLQSQHDCTELSDCRLQRGAYSPFFYELKYCLSASNNAAIIKSFQPWIQHFEHRYLKKSAQSEELTTYVFNSARYLNSVECKNIFIAEVA